MPTSGSPAGGQFRSTVWDPCHIVTQIAALQLVFYASLAVILFAFDWLMSSSRSMDKIFKYQSLFLNEPEFAKVLAAFLCNAFVGSVALWCLVGRAKQCLDFAATSYFLHFLLCCWYNGWTLASTVFWWLLHLICATLTTVMAEYLCLRSELQAIPVRLATADL